MPAIRAEKAKTSSSAGPSKDSARPVARSGKHLIDSKYRKGDFEITSADTLFRLPSYYMLAANSVLRDAHEIGTNGGKFELDLSEARTTTIRLFVDIIIDHEATVTELCPVSRLRDVLVLCEKLDCPGVVKSIMAALDLAIEDGNPHRIGVLEATATASGHRQFEKCIRVAGHFSRKAQVGLHPELNIAPGAPLIRDPASWSSVDFCRLPPIYTWALLRSYRTTKGQNEQADKLKHLLELIGAPSVDTTANETADAITVANTL